jgi:BAAT / Acyl-CoA thioester hydrolase C terminal
MYRKNAVERERGAAHIAMRPGTVTNLYYPGAGHYFFGFPPNFPFFATTFVAGMGGSAQADALATEQFWTRMITFLNHLAVHQPMPS